MNIYTKLSLLALLSANTFFGMEKPQPAKKIVVDQENELILPALNAHCVLILSEAIKLIR